MLSGPYFFAPLQRRSTSDYSFHHLKMLFQQSIFPRRPPSGFTILSVTGSLLFILIFLTASRSHIRARAAAYFPSSASLDIVDNVFNRTLGVSCFPSCFCSQKDRSELTCRLPVREDLRHQSTITNRSSRCNRSLGGFERYRCTNCRCSVRRCCAG
jgi:hypothetical protein